MPDAIWPELESDGAWDPWLLGPLLATFAGWENGEAVAVEAVTVNDAAKPAGRWRNAGGAGAAVWEAADGTPIADAMDASFSVYKPFNGQTGSFSGAVTVESLAASGDVSGATGTFSGAVTAESVTAETGDFSGEVTVGTLVSAGDISGTTGTFSGAVTADSLTAAGAVTAESLAAETGTFSGEVTVDTLVADGLIEAAGATFTGPVLVQANMGFHLQNNPSVGAWTVNPTNLLDPSLELYDADLDLMAAFHPSGADYAFDVVSVKVQEVLFHDGTELGFFGAPPATRANISGTLSGTPTLAQLASVVRSIVAAADENRLGLWNDTTS